MDEHFTERAASSAAKWHKTVLDPAGDGKRWGWTLWHVELEMEAVRQLIAAEGQEGKEGQIVVVVKASTYRSLCFADRSEVRTRPVSPDTTAYCSSFLPSFS
jgi:hypothetical protein